jgi:hypothetical protein
MALRLSVIATSLAAALTAVGATGAAAPSKPPLAAVALTATELGAGYARRLYPGGNQVAGRVTLDLCGGGYASEALRTGRLQYGYVTARKTDVWLSNEVVSYRPGGARQALREIATHIRRCPSGPVDSPVLGTPPISYHFTRLSTRGLLPGAIAVLIHMKATVKGKQLAASSVAVYQARGDVLSALYSHTGTDAAQSRLTLRKAQTSAAKLKRLS